MRSWLCFVEKDLSWQKAKYIFHEHFAFVYLVVTSENEYSPTNVLMILSQAPPQVSLTHGESLCIGNYGADYFGRTTTSTASSKSTAARLLG